MKVLFDFRRVAKRGAQFLFVATAILSIGACAKPSAPPPEKPSFMLVQVAEDVKVDAAASTIRLRNVGQQTIYFSDRPVRMAGHVKMDEYLWQWTDAAGKNNLSADPPNATLSVYEPGQPDNKITVITISNPKIDGADLVYNYKLVDGTLPENGGETSLFIDMIGVGGGVGVGFHGVGVGLRGPGLR